MSKSLPSTNPGTTDSNPPVTDPSAPSYTSSLAHLRQKLATPIDATACIPISLYACFLTGFTSSPSFSACYIWCGFQTGNLAQLGLALARTFAPIDEYRTYGIQKPDQQALVSLFSFIIGATLGRFGDAVGAKTRRWLVGATGLQVLLSAAAALTAHYSGESGIALERGEPSWSTALGMVTLGFISATMGIQGIIGKRIASPMNTTVVLTTTWVELFNDPFLFSLKSIPSRDVRIMGVLAVFFGSFFARAILQSHAGQAGCLGVLAGLRAIQMVWWGLIRDAHVV